MLAAYQILDYKSFKQLNKKQFLNMTRNVNGIPTKLFPGKVKLLINCIEYNRSLEANCDYDLAANPTSWDTKEGKRWRALEIPKSIAIFTPQ